MDLALGVSGPLAPRAVRVAYDAGHGFVSLLAMKHHDPATDQTLISKLATKTFLVQVMGNAI